MKTTRYYVKESITYILIICLTGCQTIDFASLPSDINSLHYNMRNIARKPTNPRDVFNNTGRVLAVISVVRKYAALNASQKQEVERIVSRRHQAHLQKEKRSLAPKYETKKKTVKKQGEAKIAAAEKLNPAKASQAEVETRKELAAVDLEWEKAAQSSAAKKYGTDYAVPVKNNEGKSVVAFASVKDSDVKVSDSSYEVDSSNLIAGTKVDHQGQSYAVLDEKVSP